MRHLLLLLAVAWLGGCSAEAPLLGPPPGTADARLAPFLACASPGEFVQAQHGVDMVRLVEELDEGSAVRLGALGPLSAEAAAVLNRKRATYLATVTREHGPALAEVFALFVLHTAFDDDLRQVLDHLARPRATPSGTSMSPMGRNAWRRSGKVRRSSHPSSGRAISRCAGW